MERPKTKAATKSPRASVPTPRLALADIPPPLLEGEDADAYEELHARVFADVQPAGVIEEFWIRDIVDLQWEISRLRRLKVNFMAATVYRGLATVLKQFHDIELTPEFQYRAGQSRNLAKDWARREPDAVERSR